MIFDKVCNLQCTKTGDVHEFVGPVKIVLVDPPKNEYRNIRMKAAFLTFATLLIGANTFCMILFCLGFKLPVYMNTHIILCTLGYQFCMPLGIMMIDSLFGPAVIMTQPQRRKQHVFLQFFGMVLYLSGSAMVILLGEKTFFDSSKPRSSIHYYSGIVALCISGLCFLTGPILLCMKSDRISSAFLTSLHRIFGILTFTSSTVCLLFGLSKTIMYLWFYILSSQMRNVTRCFCVTATIIVIYSPFMNIIRNSKKNLSKISFKQVKAFRAPY